MSEYEFTIDGGKTWFDVNHEREIVTFDAVTVSFRIKPRTIKVNGFDVPWPISDASAFTGHYFMPSVAVDILYFAQPWYGSDTDNLRLSRNICHTTK